MDSTIDSEEIPGDFNESLRDDAEEFGGSGESQPVSTYHARVTKADLAEFADTKEPLIVGEVALVWRGHSTADPPVDFTAHVSEATLERLAQGDIVNYGIRHIDGENQTVHISCGGVSDLFDDERTPKERIREEEPHLRRYL